MKIHAAKTSIRSGLALKLTIGVVVLWNLIGLFFPVLQLSENQNLYIYSSAAQVIAGIYGLTIAGYAFLRNQQDRQIDKDESLAEIFERIQMQQHRSVLVITLISGLAIFGALLSIALREIDALFIGTIAINTASALFVTSLGWTAYFVVDAMRPEKILSASESIKEEIVKQEVVKQDIASTESPPIPIAGNEYRPEKGNLELFLTSYNAIERRLEEYAESHFYARPLNDIALQQVSNPSEYRSPRARWARTRIIKALASQRLIPIDFADELLALVKYRNALVHGRDMTVEDSMVLRVEEARQRLDSRLSVEDTPM